MEKSTTRREFLTQIRDGVIATPFLFVGAMAVTKATAFITGAEVGNPNYRESLKKDCNHVPPEECLMENMVAPQNLLHATVVAPFVEEVCFRFTPSFILNIAEGVTIKKRPELSEEEVARKVKYRSLITGVFTSFIFGYAHNITPDWRFNTKNIPSPQIALGAAFWYLQRHKGLAANTTAHVGFNTAAILSSYGLYKLEK